MIATYVTGRFQSYRLLRPGNTGFCDSFIEKLFEQAARNLNPKPLTVHLKHHQAR